jgi:prepilin-type N-terminal cleavage/methylation domain-containing protein
MKKFSKGFTLIELLVVIAIIGILSSVVLASLSTARSKGSDARVQSQLQAMRAQAELYTGTGTALAAGVCSTAGTTNLFFDVDGVNSLKNLFNGLSSGATNGAAAGRCASSAGLPSTGASWAVAYPLSSGAWCVDSTGISRGTPAGSATAYTSAAAAITGVVCL